VSKWDGHKNEDGLGWKGYFVKWFEGISNKSMIEIVRASGA
jgi:hypothetical protein